MSLSWNDLFLSGSVFDLNISQWSGHIKIQPSDLGIENSDAVAKALSLGHHRLIPKKAIGEIAEIITKAKKAIDRYSLNFSFIRGARYVPEKNLEPLLARLKSCKSEFDFAVAAFVCEYEAVKQEMLPFIREALHDAAKSDGAADAAFDRVLSEYPPADEISRKFDMRWSVYAIRGPSSKALENEGNAVKDVLKGMVSGLREEVTGKLSEVLGIIAKGGTLKPRSVEAALAVLERVESVNVLGDETLAEQIGQIRKALQTVESGKIIDRSMISSLEDVKKTLETSLDEAVAAAENNLTGLGKRRLEVA